MAINYEEFINPVVYNAKTSGIRKFFDLAATMDDVISLGIGEPDFVTPQKFMDAAIKSLNDGNTAYSSNTGMLELRQEISKYLERRFQVEYNPESEIIVTVGGSEAIDAVFRTLVSPGDEILIPDPAFVSYEPCVKIAGGVPVLVPTTMEEGFKLTAAKLEELITPRTKAVLLNFPCNPTGVIATRADLEEIAKVCIKHNIIAISDEIYAELTYGGNHVSIASLPNMAERTILISGVSKAFAMTGWRIGYICGPATLIPYINKIHQFGIMCAPTIGQYASIEAFRNGQDEVDRMVSEYERRNKLIVRRFKEIGFEIYEPQGAFYAFPSIKSTGLTSDEFCNQLLVAKKVACVPGNAFGDCGEGHIRCSYATSYEKIEAACDAIEDFVNTL